MRIRRSNPEDNFFIAPNDTFRDDRLTYMARGILAELLTHSDGWEINSETLWRIAQQKRGKRAEGRRALRSALAELEEQGYLVRRRVQGDRGRWRTDTEISDAPARRGTDYGTSVSVTSAEDTSASATLKRSTNQEEPSKEELSKEELSKEDSAALASARAAADAAQENDHARLGQLYAAVDSAHAQELHDGLLVLERKRPRIFRECRQSALEQIEEQNGAGRFKRQGATRSVDALAYKYVLQHYAPKWPAWLLRPIGVAEGSR